MAIFGAVEDFLNEGDGVFFGLFAEFVEGFSLPSGVGSESGEADICGAADIGESFDPDRAIIPIAAWAEGGNGGLPVSVRINISGDCRLICIGGSFGSLSPDGGGSEFDVGDLGGDSGLFGNVLNFVNGFEGFVGFVAHVRDVESVIDICSFGEGDDFFGIAVVSGVVFEAGTESKSTVAHILGDELSHFLNLDWSGKSLVIFAQDLAPDSAMTSEGGEVD